ncbi:hypothetical protein [Hylemonella gracilis]|nr:hypothetical protein [Hylemonella gracilis]
MPHVVLLGGAQENDKLSFYARLLWAWAAMGFRVPKIDFVHGGLDAQ